MEFDSDRMGRLKDFGVSVYAARAYLALLELGIAEARGVSELAGVPTAKVYGTLEQLEQRGLAQVALGRPRKYMPVAMDDFIDRQIHDQEERLASLRDRKETLSHLFAIVGTTQVADRARIASVSGRRNVLQRFREACHAARQDVFIADAEDPTSEGSPLARLLGQAAGRGVSVHVVPEIHRLGRTSLESALPEVDFAADDGHEPPGHVAIATFDGRMAIFLRLRPEGSKSDRVAETALCTSETAFVQPLRVLLALQYANAVAARARSPTGLRGAHSPPSRAGTAFDGRVFVPRHQA